MKIPKEYRPLAKAAREQDWTIGPTKGGHLVWISPSGGKVFTPATPSDWRSLPNVIRKLKHKGLQL